MKRSRPASPPLTYENIVISQSKVQKLIQQEVNIALKKKETRLDRLLENIQELDSRIDYEGSLQKLEAQIKRVTKRAEAVHAYVTKTQLKNSQAVCNDAEISRTYPEEETMETVSYSDANMTPASLTDFTGSEFLEKSRELSELVENTTQVLVKLRAENTALNAAIEDLSANPPPPSPPPAPTSYTAFGICIKTEPEDDSHGANLTEQPLKMPKLEPCSPEFDESVGLLHPPLPPLPFPLNLHPHASSYNVPQRLSVKLALIKTPACLSVLWTVDERDPLAPPMDTYSVYMSTEKVKGSNIFPYWRNVETLKALPLPMYKMIYNYQPGHKVCVVVVGKDIFDRYGPFSHVVIATIPEDE